MVHEARAVDQLHGEEALLLVGGELVERHQIGMRHVGESSELFLEDVEHRRVRGMEGLEGHLLLAPAIVDRVDHPHAAGSELLEDDETRIVLIVGAEHADGAYPKAGRERQTADGISSGG